MTARPLPTLAVPILVAAAVLAGIGLDGAPAQEAKNRPAVVALGSLVQLPGSAGCVVDRSTPARGCASVRALRGPAPFLGSQAVAISPDGSNVYVASSASNAIAVFRRDASTGTLTQAGGAGGCIAAAGAGGCARALGLIGPSSVAVSPDGRNVYATAVTSDAVDVFRRNPTTGALAQAGDGSGCLASAARTGCSAGRALTGADVVRVSPDGQNVYVGAFRGDAVAVFARNASTGALVQPTGATGCIVQTAADGCATGVALAGVEGMAISNDGNDVYVAAALSNALDTFSRNASTGALSQATSPAGCIVDVALAGCTTGTQVSGANAVAVSPDDADVYVTSLLSSSITSFARTATTGYLAQLPGTSACVIYLLAVGCSLGRALSAPEGLAVSPDGASVYVDAFATGALDVLDRSGSGALVQKSRQPGCVTAAPVADCALGRGLLGASSVAVSPDGRYVYSGAFASNAVDVFRRVAAVPPARAPITGRGVQ